jgi:hypothetical protein
MNSLIVTNAQTKTFPFILPLQHSDVALFLRISENEMFFVAEKRLLLRFVESD